MITIQLAINLLKGKQAFRNTNNTVFDLFSFEDLFPYEEEFEDWFPYEEETKGDEVLASLVGLSPTPLLTKGY